MVAWEWAAVMARYLKAIWKQTNLSSMLHEMNAKQHRVRVTHEFEE
jgi:hypothetical protein